MRRSLGDLRDPRPSGDAQRRLEWEEDTLRVRGGLWGVKRGTTGHGYGNPRSELSHGTVSPRPRSRGPKPIVRGRSSSRPRGARRLWAQDAEDVVGAGHDPSPCPRARSHRCHRRPLGPGAPHPNSRRVSVVTSRPSPAAPAAMPVLTPRAAVGSEAPNCLTHVQGKAVCVQKVTMIPFKAIMSRSHHLYRKRVGHAGSPSLG